MAVQDMQRVPSSFRDPSGFVFRRQSSVFRFVSTHYRADFDLLMRSGLYDVLVHEDLLVRHEEVHDDALSPSAYKILRPEQIPFVSYPYEWTLSQLKDAALLTLKVQSTALAHDMTLKDASAYNIQFLRGKPVMIDTLSFEAYDGHSPWVAYKQFCQHFLAPLALMAKCDLRMGTLLREYLDGIPLDLASRLLPIRTRFSPGLGAHIHLHARAQKRYEDTSRKLNRRSYTLSKNRLVGILASLTSTVRSLSMPRQKTEWGEYYTDTNYSSAAAQHKRELVKEWIMKIRPSTVWDAGANEANFSSIASERHIPTVATDVDPLAVDRAYVQARERRDESLLPLLVNMTNPSPPIGWNNTERESFLARCHVDLAMCLAFLHHLAIGDNLTFGQIAELFAAQCHFLIIEFIPKEDSNAQRLLVSRKDIFSSYTQKSFEQSFAKVFDTMASVPIRDSARTLFLLKKRPHHA